MSAPGRETFWVSDRENNPSEAVAIQMPTTAGEKLIEEQWLMVDFQRQPTDPLSVHGMACRIAGHPGREEVWKS
jgi:hypothetical protein